MTTRNLGLAAGYTPSNFLVQNITGHFSWRLFGGHFTLFGDRDPVKDTQLSYAGLHDPATITPLYIGKSWGGVVSSTGGARIDLGSGGSGFYFSADGGILHGYHVLNNSKFEGAMGAYLRVKNWPSAGSLTVGGALFGMHYHYDEAGLSYGQGGYFSPDSYFLAAVPVTFNGAYKSSFHYLVSGAFGVQTFQQDWEYFYPLDPGLQSNLQVNLGCTLAQLAAHTCAEYPVSGRHQPELRHQLRGLLPLWRALVSGRLRLRQQHGQLQRRLGRLLLPLRPAQAARVGGLPQRPLPGRWLPPAAGPIARPDHSAQNDKAKTEADPLRG